VGRKTGRHEGAAYDRSSGQDNAPRAAGRARTGPPPGGGRVCDGGAHRRGARPRAPFAVPARRPALVRGRPLLAGRVPARTGAWLRAGCQARPRAGRAGGLDAAGGVEAGCLRSRAAGQPAPPAGIRAGCLHPGQRRGRARGHRPGPPRARPCRPSPPAGPGRPPALAPPPTATAGPYLFPPWPGPAVPGSRLPPPARRGPDLTGRAERSVRRRDPTDGPPPGTVTAPGRPPTTPDNEPGTPGDPLLTIEEVTAELRVSRAAFYRWRRQGAGPPAVRLPGGGVRVRRSALSQWLRRLEENTTAEEQGADGQLRRQVLGH
jgi:excisionase family DNA binding protein